MSAPGSHLDEEESCVDSRKERGKLAQRAYRRRHTNKFHRLQEENQQLKDALCEISEIVARDHHCNPELDASLDKARGMIGLEHPEMFAAVPSPVAMYELSLRSLGLQQQQTSDMMAHISLHPTDASRFTDGSQQSTMEVMKAHPPVFLDGTQIHNQWQHFGLATVPLSDANSMENPNVSDCPRSSIPILHYVTGQ